MRVFVCFILLSASIYSHAECLVADKSGDSKIIKEGDLDEATNRTCRANGKMLDKDKNVCILGGDFFDVGKAFDGKKCLGDKFGFQNLEAHNPIEIKCESDDYSNSVVTFSALFFNTTEGTSEVYNYELLNYEGVSEFNQREDSFTAKVGDQKIEVYSHVIECPSDRRSTRACRYYSFSIENEEKDIRMSGSCYPTVVIGRL